MVEFLKELVKNQAFVSAFTGLVTLLLFNAGLKQELVNAVVAVLSAFLAALGAYLAVKVVRARRKLRKTLPYGEDSYLRKP